MACRAGVWSRVGNAPIGRFADRIIRPTESPRRCGTHGFGRASPTGISGRIIRTGHGIESPDFLSCPGIVSDDVTVGAASSRTTATRQHLIAKYNRSGSERPARFCFPSKLSGSGIQPYDETIGSGEQDQVFEDAESFGARWPARGPFVLPDQLPVRGVQSLNGSAFSLRGDHDVHDAVMNDGNDFDRAGRVGPDLCEPARVLLVELIQRAVALRVIRPAVHQPVVVIITLRFS